MCVVYSIEMTAQVKPISEKQMDFANIPLNITLNITLFPVNSL